MIARLASLALIAALALGCATRSPAVTPRPSPTPVSLASVADGRTPADDVFRHLLVPGAVVDIPAGRFLLERGIAVPDSAALEGAGESTVLVAAPGTSISVVRNADSERGNKDITVEHLRIEGGANGVVLWNVKGGTVTGIHALNPAGAGIVVRHSSDVEVDDSIAEGAGNDNFHVWDGSERVNLRRDKGLKSAATVATALSAGFEVADGARDVLLEDCQTAGNAYSGVAIHNHKGTTGPYDVTVRRLTSRGDRFYGVNVLAQAVDGPQGIVLEAIDATGMERRAIHVTANPGLPVPKVTIR